MYRFITDEAISVVRGLIPSARAITIFGFGSGEFDTIRTSRESTEPYFYITTPVPLSLVSTSALDTGAGTGAQQVTIEGLNQNWESTVEVVTLNGLTPVLTTNQFFRINGLIISRAGTGQTNAGTITVTSGGNFIERIPTNNRNLSVTPVFTVPLGYNGYLTDISLSSEGSNSIIQHNAVVRFNDGSGRPPRMRFSMALENKVFVSNLKYPILIPEKCDLEMKALELTPGANSRVTTGFTILLITK